MLHPDTHCTDQQRMSSLVTWSGKSQKYDMVIFFITGDKTNDCKNLARLRST